MDIITGRAPPPARAESYHTMPRSPQVGMDFLGTRILAYLLLTKAASVAQHSVPAAGSPPTRSDPMAGVRGDMAAAVVEGQGKRAIEKENDKEQEKEKDRERDTQKKREREREREMQRMRMPCKPNKDGIENSEKRKSKAEKQAVVTGVTVAVSRALGR